MSASHRSLITMSLLKRHERLFPELAHRDHQLCLLPDRDCCRLSRSSSSMSDQMASNCEFRRSRDPSVRPSPSLAMHHHGFFRDIPLIPRDHAPNHRKYSADIPAMSGPMAALGHPLRRPAWLDLWAGPGPVQPTPCRPRRGWGNAGAGGQVQGPRSAAATRMARRHV